MGAGTRSETTKSSEEPHGSSSSSGKKMLDPMAVTWMEKYNEPMEKIWARLPGFLGSAIVSFAVFALGATMRGDWLMILVHFLKYIGYWGNVDTSTGSTWNWTDFSSVYFKNFSVFLFWAVGVSYAIYFGMGGFLHWFWYVRQRDRSHEWKCQPDKWLAPELERHEILVGTMSLGITSSISAILACYIANGGWSTIYYKFDDYTWMWWFLQWIVIFVYQDYVTYWSHRMYHTPFMYKHFHKLHHKYKQPTAFSVTAIHPVEILNVQALHLLPIFIIPVHFVPFYGVAFYNYIHGILDHSGIYFKSYWWQPWQPDSLFHDNHHQYFHVNFGFNMDLWDKIYGTYRLKDRIYSEDVFYGKGKSVAEATIEELEADNNERRAESKVANTEEIPLSKTEGKKVS